MYCIDNEPTVSRLIRLTNASTSQQMDSAGPNQTHVDRTDCWGEVIHLVDFHPSSLTEVSLAPTIYQLGSSTNVQRNPVDSIRLIALKKVSSSLLEFRIDIPSGILDLKNETAYSQVGIKRFSHSQNSQPRL